MMRYLIFGGAGFIGVNLANRLAQDGHTVMVVDNLSRRGSENNLAWLRKLHPGVRFYHCDIRFAGDVERLFEQIDTPSAVIHLAAQVAVTTSVIDPNTDFAINAAGTFHVLEGVRRYAPEAAFLFASTNKVYGGMESVRIHEEANRYQYTDIPQGIDENFPLDFHSPYGCSKGCADQYVRDYARIYGMRTVVFRQSAIYGPRQFGVEDQGWVAWFSIAAAKNRSITIYGDGKQVRDLLWVDDLIDAYLAAIDQIDKIKGEVFNIGGGPDFSISVWKEFGPMLCQALGREIPVSTGDWRPGDQKVCIMNIDKAHQQLGWQPHTPVEVGVQQITQWVTENLDIL